MLCSLASAGDAAIMLVSLWVVAAVARTWALAPFAMQVVLFTMVGAEDRTAPMLRDIQDRATEAMRFLQLTEGDLPADLRVEADQLAAELESDLAVLIHFVEDFLQREHMLTAEDRCATWYAVGCTAGAFARSS